MKKMKPKVTILTLFPEMIQGFFNTSILGRAQQEGQIEIDLANLRNWGIGRHKSVDDTPYGGGAGMVLRCDVVAQAISTLRENSKRDTKVVLMTPQGAVFNQRIAQTMSTDLASSADLILVCGHYEGFDERIRDYVDLELSIGDYVLTGGEAAAAVITDAVMRLLPGVLGKEASHQDESFTDPNILEYPQYTRPEEYEGKKVPEVLKSGHHQEIENWRRAEARIRTQKRRPDLG